MHKILLVSLFISVFTLSVFPQADSSSQSMDDSKSLSRVKLSVGYFLGKYSAVGENFPFINFNYHATILGKHSMRFDSGLFCEAGINYFEGLFPPYIKAGPQLKLYKNFIAGLSAGFVGILVYPIPFYGMNFYHLFELYGNSYVELETGFHLSFISKDIPIFYLSIGVSII